MPPKNKQNNAGGTEDSNLAHIKTLTEIVNKLIYSYDKNEKINLTKVQNFYLIFKRIKMVFSLSMTSQPKTLIVRFPSSLISSVRFLKPIKPSFSLF